MSIGTSSRVVRLLLAGVVGLAGTAVAGCVGGSVGSRDGSAGGDGGGDDDDDAGGGGDDAGDDDPIDARRRVDGGDCSGITELDIERVADDLEQPVYVTTPPGDPGSLYVVEKPGRIKIIRDGAAPVEFLDITARVNIPTPNSEGGLLSLLFAPDYATSGRFFIYYTAIAADALPERAVVQEWHRSDANHDGADDAPVRDILWNRHGGYNHVGGNIAWGPDGMLYLGLGDAAGSPSAADDIEDRLGKILRVDADDPATPPAGNLPGGDPYVWDYGLRNPWRMSFDRDTGDLYIGDVGAQTWEEIDVEPARTGHRDYGWPTMEADHCRVAGCTPRGTGPVVEHAHDEASAIVGGYVYRGGALSCLRGRYIYSDYGTSRFFSFVWDGEAAQDRQELTAQLGNGDLAGVASFGEDSDGELYIVSITLGTVDRIVARAP